MFLRSKTALAWQKADFVSPPFSILTLPWLIFSFVVSMVSYLLNRALGRGAEECNDMNAWDSGKDSGRGEGGAGRARVGSGVSYLMLHATNKTVKR